VLRSKPQCRQEAKCQRLERHWSRSRFGARFSLEVKREIVESINRYKVEQRQNLSMGFPNCTCSGRRALQTAYLILIVSTLGGCCIRATLLISLAAYLSRHGEPQASSCSTAVTAKRCQPASQPATLPASYV
jgi:hypothetical protein